MAATSVPERALAVAELDEEGLPQTSELLYVARIWILDTWELVTATVSGSIWRWQIHTKDIVYNFKTQNYQVFVESIHVIMVALCILGVQYDDAS